MKAMQTVEIRNVTKGTVLAQQAKMAASLGQRMKGLLGRDSLPDGQAMILKPCSAIHTLFMRFSIDVLFLDRQMRIVHLISNLAPYRFSPTVWASRLVIELPAGKISQTKTQIGDILALTSPK